MRKPASWKQEAAGCRQSAGCRGIIPLPGFGAEPQSLTPQHFSRALRAPEGRKKRGSPQNQGFFNGLGFLETGSRFFLSPQRLAALPGPRSHTPPFSNSALKQKIGHHDFCISVQRKQKRSGRACVRCSFSVFCSISPLPFRLEKPFLRCLRTLLFQEGKLAIIWIKFLKNLLKWA